MDGAIVGLVVAGQHIETVFGHVTDDSNSRNNAADQVCLQDVVATEGEQPTGGRE